jgi:hypothetical protein
MATHYIYSPFNGIGWARDCYHNNCSSGGTGPCYNSSNNCTSCGTATNCATPPDQRNGCPHCAGAGCSLAGDIGGVPANTSVYFNVSGTFNKITISYPSFCVVTTCSSNGTNCSTTCPQGNSGVLVSCYNNSTLIGKVLYGHIVSRAATGTYMFPNFMSMRLGYVGADCQCCCIYGTHVHMGITGTGAARYPWNYNQTLSSSQWVYKWVQ